MYNCWMLQFLLITCMLMNGIFTSASQADEARNSEQTLRNQRARSRGVTDILSTLQSNLDSAKHDLLMTGEIYCNDINTGKDGYSDEEQHHIIECMINKADLAAKHAKIDSLQKSIDEIKTWKAAQQHEKPDLSMIQVVQQPKH